MCVLCQCYRPATLENFIHRIPDHRSQILLLDFNTCITSLQFVNQVFFKAGLALYRASDLPKGFTSLVDCHIIYNKQPELFTLAHSMSYCQSITRNAEMSHMDLMTFVSTIISLHF